MKKTIAKLMAAAMLVASVPAMVLPTFTVDAAHLSDSVSITKVTYGGTTSTTGWTYDATVANTYAAKLGDPVSTLKINDSFSMKDQNNVINTSIYYYKEGTWTSSNPYSDAKKLDAAVDLTAGEDFVDDTGYSVVKTAKISTSGELVLTFDPTGLGNYNTNVIAKNSEAKTIKFYPFLSAKEDDASGNDSKEVFAIQIGETLSASRSTTVEALTEDGHKINVTFKKNDSSKVTLEKVDDAVKKVAWKGEDITLDQANVGGIYYDITRFADQALKNSKIKKITAKNVKNLETGALRGSKKLTRVRMGGAKMRKIHSNAFYDCEKLKNIKINCKNLKAVGSKAFKGLKKNCTITIKAGAAKYKKVVKMIKKSGTDQVKFKKA